MLLVHIAQASLQDVLDGDEAERTVVLTALDDRRAAQRVLGKALWGTGLATATLLGSLSCTAPIAGAGLLAYLLIAVRASRPLAAGVRP